MKPMSKVSIRIIMQTEIRGWWDREGMGCGEWACEGEPKGDE